MFNQLRQVCSRDWLAESQIACADLLNTHLTMCDKLKDCCDLTFKRLVKKLKYIDAFFTLGVVHQHSKRGGGRRERGGREREREREVGSGLCRASS